MRDAIEFDPNVPQRIALQYSTGKIIEGRNGQRVMYSLADGRVMFLDLDVAEQINQLKPRPGEAITITKAKSGREVSWFVEREPRAGEQGDGTFAVPVRATAAVTAAAAANAASQPHHSDGSNGNIPANGNGNHAAPAPPPAAAPVGVPRTQLEDALCTVVHACHQARLFAKLIGYEAMPPFTSEDIRTMANTILIQKGGR